MRSNLVCAALACAVLLLAATEAIAANEPIPGVDIVVKKHPGGSAITATTDTDGRITLKGLTPGDYEIVVDGPSLVAAMDKLTSAPEKKHESSFGLGIGGGMFGGGGSRHSSSGGGQGAGPIGGNQTPSSHGGSHSSGGGGMAVGVSIPIGGGGHDSDNGDVQRMLEIGWDRHDATGDALESMQMPYCPDSAQQGMRIHFTVPPGPANSDYTGWYLGFGIGYSDP